MPATGTSLSDAVQAGMPGMEKQFSSLQASTAANLDVQKQAGEAYQADVSKDEGERKALLDQAKQEGGGLSPPKLTPPPVTKPTDPVSIWGSSAIWAAALGGLLTRRPILNSLNAMASVVNAFRQQDAEAAKTAFDNWKVENDNAIKMFTFANETLKDELTAVDESEKIKFQNYQITAKALGDEQAANVGSFDEAMKLITERDRHADEMAKAAPDMDLKYQQLQLGLAIVNAGKKLQAAQASGNQAAIDAAKIEFQNAQQSAQGFNMGLGKGGAAASATVLTDDAMKSMAEQYLAGDKSVVTSMGYGSAGAANRARLQEMIRQIAKEKGMSGGDIAAAMAEFAGMTAGERTLSTTQARIGLGAAEIQKLEPQVLEASQELARTNYPNFNAVIQTVQRGTGDPALKNLAVRLQGLKSAFSQVLTRGGVPTDSARATTDELFNTKDPPRVMKAAMDAMNAETSAIEQAPGVVRQQLREGISGNKTQISPPPRGPAPAHLNDRPIWPSGDHWIFEDGSPAK